MSVSDDRACDRRELLRRMGSVLASGGLVALSGALVAKSLTAPQRDACVRDGLCRGCRLLNGCRLPQARSFRDRATGR